MTQATKRTAGREGDQAPAVRYEEDCGDTNNGTSSPICWKEYQNGVLNSEGTD